MSDESPLDLLEFPCDYEFKAFGPNDAAFTVAVKEAVGRVQAVSRHALRERASRQGTYRCVTVLVRLQSRDQLEAIYRALRGIEGLRYLL